MCISVANATPDYYGFQPINADYLANGWNMVHLTGSMALNIILRVRYDLTPLEAGIITVVANFTWEFFDTAYANLRKGPSALDQILDKRGPDWRDPTMGAIGVITSNVACGIRFRNKTPMATITIKLR